MALPRGELSILLRDLRAAGPVDRVRLLARSLSSLRRLSPWDRKILLRMAGFEGAEALVERLAQDDEATAGRLRRLLAELEKEPEELERTVRELGDPKRRSQAVDELLATLDRGMTAEEEAEPAGEAAQGPPGTPPREADRAPLPEPPPVPPPGAGPAPLPEAPPVPERPVPLVRPAAPHGTRPSVGRASGPPAGGTPALPTSAEAPVPQPSRAEQASEPPAIPAEAREVQASLQGAEPESRPEPLPKPPPPASASVPAAPPEAVDGAPASAAAVLDRLLALRRGAAGPPPGAAELGRTLEREIPFPWARRRALQAWIEAGGATDLDGALGLIRELPAPADRSWCLSTLLAHGAWSAAERERIAAAAPTPAARRRLERRRDA